MIRILVQNDGFNKAFLLRGISSQVRGKVACARLTWAL
jgi:hypothetical protein